MGVKAGLVVPLMMAGLLKMGSAQDISAMAPEANRLIDVRRATGLLAALHSFRLAWKRFSAAAALRCSLPLSPPYYLTIDSGWSGQVLTATEPAQNGMKGSLFDATTEFCACHSLVWQRWRGHLCVFLACREPAHELIFSNTDDSVWISG
jgi:hypothetical protein